MKTNVHTQRTIKDYNNVPLCLLLTFKAAAKEPDKDKTAFFHKNEMHTGSYESEAPLQYKSTGIVIEKSLL